MSGTTSPATATPRAGAHPAADSGHGQHPDSHNISRVRGGNISRLRGGNISRLRGGANKEEW